MPFEWVSTGTVESGGGQEFGRKLMGEWNHVREIVSGPESWPHCLCKELGEGKEWEGPKEEEMESETQVGVDGGSRECTKTTHFSPKIWWCC